VSLGTPTQKTFVADPNNLAIYGPSASVSANAGDLILVAAYSWSNAGNVAAPSLVAESTNTLRLVRLAATVAASANRPSLALWAAQCRAAFTGTFTVTYPAGTQRGCIFQVTVIPGASLAAAVRPDNLVTSAGTGTSNTSTLPKALAGAAHYHFLIHAHQKSENLSGIDGFTRVTGAGDLSVVDSGNTTEATLAVLWKANATSGAFTWASSVAWAALSVEIQAPVFAAVVDVDRPKPVWLVNITPALA